MPDNFLPSAAVALAGAVALGVVARNPRTFQNWLFFGGMAMLCGVTVLDGMSLRAADSASYIYLHSIAMATRALAAAIWIAFSIRYARAPEENAKRWRLRWG